MKRIGFSSLVIAVAVIASAVIAAEKKGDESSAAASAEHKMFDPANMTWGDGPPFLPPGVQFAVLSGDPTKKGVFTVRLRMPAGYKIPPHTHPAVELITPISGSLHIGTGATFNESAGHAMPPGSFMAMPAGTKHFAWASEDTVVQVHGEGPFAIKYVNPADDPRNTKK